MRIPFRSLFHTTTDGALIPLRRVDINGQVLRHGQRVRRGRLVGGLRIHQAIGRDLEVREDSGLAIITGVY
jgi:hypothetical protein